MCLLADEPSTLSFEARFEVVLCFAELLASVFPPVPSALWPTVSWPWCGCPYQNYPIPHLQRGRRPIESMLLLVGEKLSTETRPQPGLLVGQMLD